MIASLFEKGFELTELARLVRQLRARGLEQPLAAVCNFSQASIRVFRIVQGNKAAQCIERNCQILAPQRFGQLQDGVAVPAELVEIGLQLAQQILAVRGIGQALHQRWAGRLRKEPPQGRIAASDAAEAPEHAVPLERPRPDAIEEKKGFGRVSRFESGSIEVLERTCRLV